MAMQTRMRVICAAAAGGLALAGQSVFAAGNDMGPVAAPAASAPAGAPPPSGNWWDPQGQPIQFQTTGAQGAGAAMPQNPSQTSPRPYANSILDYPAGQVSDWVVASAMAARSRAMLTRAESELSGVIRRQQQHFERSKEYREAEAVQKQTYDDYTAARSRAIASLVGDARYRAISQLRDEMGDKIAERRKAKDVTRDELVAMATLKLQYASDARAIEMSALASNAELKTARDRMVEASRKMSELRGNFEDALRDHPEVLLARRNLADAQVSVVEAHALASAAGVASSYAINYSYYLHRNDNGGTFGPYGPNGNYGVGFSSPYWGR